MAVSAYSITDLGTLGGTGSYAYGINASGQVVGTSGLTGNTAAHAFLYSGGVMTDLGSLGGTRSYASGINDSGQIVGQSWLTGDPQIPGFPPLYLSHAFLYSGGIMADLGTLGGSYANANAINNSGQVVGVSNLTGDPKIDFFSYLDHSFLYSGGVMSDLDNISGGTGGRANAVNNAGQVVGQASGSPAAGLAGYGYLYSNGVMTPLPGLYTATGINDSGQIVGGILGDNGVNVGLYSGGVYSDLGTLGRSGGASDINNIGQIVGAYYREGEIGGPDATRAFLYSDGALIDLNLLMASTGWTLLDATAINDAGQIVGYGRNPQSQTRAFLLTPVPLPAAFWLFGSALAALGCVRKRRYV